MIINEHNEFILGHKVQIESTKLFVYCDGHYETILELHTQNLVRKFHFFCDQSIDDLVPLF